MLRFLPVNLSRILIIAAIAAVICLGSAALCDDITDKINGGEINWSQQFYYATGDGAVPRPEDEPNRAKAYLKARSYAKMQAVANLRMVIDGTTISFDMTGKDYVATDTVLRQTIEGFVSFVDIVGEKRISESGDTIIQVTARAPMYGSTGLASALIGSRLRARPPLKLDSRLVVKIPKNTPTSEGSITQPASGSFSSLVVNCGKFRMNRSICPVIRMPDGREVWGRVKIPADVAVAKGIVGYVVSLDEAKRNPRCGPNPLFVKAIGVAGGRFASDPVISEPDANRILEENKSSKFLDAMNVLFVIDPTVPPPPEGTFSE